MRIPSRLAFAARALLAAAAPLSAQAPPAPPYHVSKQIVLGGEGGWDYLIADGVAHRLFVSHGTRVEVVDLARDTAVGAILNTPGVHGIAFAEDLGRGFTSNGRDSTVTIFDLASLNTIGTVNVGARNPDAILYDPGTHRVFTMNGGSGNATAIEGASGTVAGKVALGGRPEFAVSDGRGRIYVNLEDSNAVVAFNARSLQVEGRWPLAGCDGPSGLAMDRDHRRLFSVCSNGLMVVMDADNGRLVTTLPIGRGVDAAAFDPGTGLAFASCGADSVLTVVHADAPDRYTVVGNVPTRRGARTMALDLTTHRVFLSTAEFGPAPAPTPERPRPRPTVIPGSFRVLVLER
jgi:DNA-binding beta-propeller fold protein YncE